MSWISRLLFGSPASAANVVAVSSLPTLSPYADVSSPLLGLVYSDIYGPTDSEAVTRDTAMTVAPINRGRGVILGAIAGQPFEQGVYDAKLDEFVPDADQPRWLTHTASAQTPYHRLALSMDDLIFTGWCLWAVQRDEAGSIIDAARVPRDGWTFDGNATTGIAIGGRSVLDPRTVMLFMGPHEGLLTVARDSIRGWRRMERAWTGRVRNPIPLMVLEEQEAGSVREDEAKEYVEAFAANRGSELGAVGFLPANLKLTVHGEIEADLFDKGRNASRIDIANHLNLPVSAVDGSTATASLTYTTEDGSRRQLSDDLDFWIAPFDARLSEEAPDGKAIRLRRANTTEADRRGQTTTKPTPPAQEASA